MSIKFEDIYAEVDSDEIDFLLEFLFQLTITGREMHSELEGVLQSDATRQLNEINHRVLNRIKSLKSSMVWSTQEYLLKMLPHHISLAPHIENAVGYAAREAYSKINAFEC